MRIVTLFLLVTILIAACAQVSVSSYEGREGDRIVEGQGGTRRLEDGIEIWISGDPPRQYRIIGMATIVDSDDALGRAQTRGAIVAQAKKAGADGAILIGAEPDPHGSFGDSSISLFNRQALHVLLVRYLDRK